MVFVACPAEERAFRFSRTFHNMERVERIFVIEIDFVKHFHHATCSSRIEIMIFDGSKLSFHEILKTPKITETWPLVPRHVLQIARGSSLARISLPGGRGRRGAGMKFSQRI